ncbi:MAG: 3'-5' exonuclease [Candidatus Berkiellales bacterium]
MNIFVFDIETVPDVETGRRLLGLENLGDEAVAEAMFAQSKEATGQTFLKLHLQRIIAISAVFRHGKSLKIWSLGEGSSPEPELIQRFFDGIEKFLPTLVSWNGSGFDLPVLHYRALKHGIAAGSYWENGEHDSTFKYNNYLNRYHTRHLDLMDVLAGYQQKGFARLDDIASMIGLPGKMGMTGSEVYENYIKGELPRIRDYCEIDVLNTYLVFLRFQLCRAHLSVEQYQHEIELTKETLKQSDQQHLQAFLETWEKT